MGRLAAFLCNILSMLALRLFSGVQQKAVKGCQLHISLPKHLGQRITEQQWEIRTLTACSHISPIQPILLLRRRIRKVISFVQFPIQRKSLLGVHRLPCSQIGGRLLQDHLPQQLHLHCACVIKAATVGEPLLSGFKVKSRVFSPIPWSTEGTPEASAEQAFILGKSGIPIDPRHAPGRAADLGINLCQIGLYLLDQSLAGLGNGLLILGFVFLVPCPAVVHAVFI